MSAGWILGSSISSKCVQFQPLHGGNFQASYQPGADKGRLRGAAAPAACPLPQAVLGQPVSAHCRRFCPPVVADWRAGRVPPGLLSFEPSQTSEFDDKWSKRFDAYNVHSYPIHKQSHIKFHFWLLTGLENSNVQSFDQYHT